MPAAEMAPGGEVATTLSYFDGLNKTTLTFQILPQLSGSFRYTATDNLSMAFNPFYDRSFDLKFRLLKRFVINQNHGLVAKRAKH